MTYTDVLVSLEAWIPEAIAPAANAHLKTSAQAHVGAIIGERFFGSFLVATRKGLGRHSENGFKIQASTIVDSLKRQEGHQELAAAQKPGLAMTRIKPPKSHLDTK